MHKLFGFDNKKKKKTQLLGPGPDPSRKPVEVNSIAWAKARWVDLENPAIWPMPIRWVFPSSMSLISPLFFFPSLFTCWQANIKFLTKKTSL